MESEVKGKRSMDGGSKMEEPEPHCPKIPMNTDRGGAAHVTWLERAFTLARPMIIPCSLSKYRLHM